MSYYEQDSTRAEYLAFHYPGSDPLEPLLGSRTPPLAERYPFAVRTLWQPRPDALALDVGAACGRVVFDLARDHPFAIGIDLARALIFAAQRVKQTGRACYHTVVEGRLTHEHDVAVETSGNAAFLIGDALALPFADARFATVVALNLVRPLQNYPYDTSNLKRTDQQTICSRKVSGLPLSAQLTKCQVADVILPPNIQGCQRRLRFTPCRI